jgi:hypothetical protein
MNAFYLVVGYEGFTLDIQAFFVLLCSTNKREFRRKSFQDT